MMIGNGGGWRQHRRWKKTLKDVECVCVLCVRGWDDAALTGVHGFNYAGFARLSRTRWGSLLKTLSHAEFPQLSHAKEPQERVHTHRDTHKHRAQPFSLTEPLAHSAQLVPDSTLELHIWCQSSVRGRPSVGWREQRGIGGGQELRWGSNKRLGRQQ